MASRALTLFAGMKRDLAQRLDQKRGAKDSTAIRLALLEVALDRYLAERTADLADLLPAAADATDMVQVVLRRAVQRRREELLDNKRPLEGTAGPADDEECANRLANTLTLLDRLAGHVPDHLVSREELESASEPRIAGRLVCRRHRRAAVRRGHAGRRGAPMGKVIRISSMGGAERHTAQQALGGGADFDKRLAAYEQRTKAHTEFIKRHLAHFIEQTMHPTDLSCVTTALLELGFERQLDLHSEEDAQDLVERCFRRVVKERRGPLQ